MTTPSYDQYNTNIYSDQYNTNIYSMDERYRHMSSRARALLEQKGGHQGPTYAPPK